MTKYQAKKLMNRKLKMLSYQEYCEYYLSKYKQIVSLIVEKSCIAKRGYVVGYVFTPLKNHGCKNYTINPTKIITD